MLIAYLGVQDHWNTLGNPSKYLKAKENIQAYINDTYDGKLEIQGIKFSTKMFKYTANIESIEDRRDEGVILCGRSGSIHDDYHKIGGRDSGTKRN